MTDRPDTPGVLAPPPIIFLAAILGGGVANWLMPLPFVPGSWRWLLGGGLILAGLALGFGALAAMRRAHTPVDPYESPTALVTDGPYRYTRNPIYLGFALISLGLAAAANALWIVLLLPLALIVVQWGVIAREERYLEARFGEAYRAYKARVRRWI